MLAPDGGSAELVLAVILPASDRGAAFQRAGLILATRPGRTHPQRKSDLLVGESFLRHQGTPLASEVCPKIRRQTGPVSGVKTTRAAIFLHFGAVFLDNFTPRYQANPIG